MNGSTPVDNKTSAGEPRAGCAGEPLVVSEGDTPRMSAGALPVGSAGGTRPGATGAPPVGSMGDTRPGAAGAPSAGSVADARRGGAGQQVVSSAVEARPARLNVAALRRAVPLRMWGGKGSGLPCDFCRVLVGPEDVEYEVEAQLDGATLMLRFHYRCHYAWTGGEEPLVAADRA